MISWHFLLAVALLYAGATLYAITEGKNVAWAIMFANYAIASLAQIFLFRG